jgi:magnesium chelatase subunit D
VLDTERIRDPRRRPLLLVLTDGRATAGRADPRVRASASEPAGGDPMAEAERAAHGLAARDVAALVVDTEDAPVRLGLAGRLATALGAPWLRLEDLAGGQLAGVVRRLTAPRRAA